MAIKNILAKEFFKTPKQIGAITPSSKFLAEKLVKAVNLESAKVIVELGAGTGTITKKILETMPKNAALLSFEINSSLSRHIEESVKDKRLKIVNDDARYIGKYLKQYSFERADCVISCLPLAGFSKEETNAILGAVSEYLSENGKFAQFQYSVNDIFTLRKIFPKVNLDFEMRNIPPAFIYVCGKK
jgi:phospholipid N-methyltransferase